MLLLEGLPFLSVLLSVWYDVFYLNSGEISYSAVGEGLPWHEEHRLGA